MARATLLSDQTSTFIFSLDVEPLPLSFGMACVVGDMMVS